MSEQDRIVYLLESLHDHSCGRVNKDIFNTLEEVYSFEDYDFDDEDIFEFYAEKVSRYNDLVIREKNTWNNLCGPDAPWPPEGEQKIVMTTPKPTLDGPIYQYVTWDPKSMEMLEDFYGAPLEEVFDAVGSELINYKPGRKFGVVNGGKS